MDDSVLFCPFCRESFEGLSECPEHELALVPFHRLPKQAHERQEPGWDDLLPLLDPRYGRALLLAGAVLAAVAFLVPFCTVSFEAQQTVYTGLAAAGRRAPNLWTVPFVAGVFLWMLLRRRSRGAMRGARPAALLLAFMPLISVAYSAWRMAQAAGGGVTVAFGPGPTLGALATLLLVSGAWRFGGPLPRPEPPQGAGPSSAPPAG
jgi:hypothetical protein